MLHPRLAAAVAAALLGGLPAAAKAPDGAGGAAKAAVAAAKAPDGAGGAAKAAGVKAPEGAAPAAPAKPHVAFLEGRPFAEVLKKAKAEKKPVMLDVVAEWCGPCKMMDRTTFADPDVVGWTNEKLVSARVDAEKGEGRKLAARYAVRSFPTVIFLHPDGNEIDRLLGAHPAGDFKRYGTSILAGTSSLQTALTRLGKTWNPNEGAQVAQTLAQRNDLARLKPLAMRVVQDDPDLTQPSTIDAFLTLVAVEDYQEKVDPETTDLMATYLPRLAADPRYGVVSVVLAREYARRGDAAAARSTVTTALKVLGDGSQFEADLLAAHALAEKNGGRLEAASAAYKKAVAAAARNQGLRASLQLDLADVQAALGQSAEAKTNLASALQLGRSDVGALTRAARVSLRLKANQDAVAHAKSAVGLSRGEDAAAQAALAAALAATGDQVGAAAAWRRAGEIEPENAEYQKRVQELKKKPAPAKAS